jgi:alkylation response protein AidB-like acyl-CoA dehydrogenase
VLGHVRQSGGAAAFSEWSAEIEERGCLPHEVLDTLSAQGFFRMAVPASLGGNDLPLIEILKAVEELAAADASIGWSVGQAVIAQVIFTHFSAQAIAEIYRDGPDVRGAGAVAPRGRAVLVDDHWRVTGRWPYLTGISHASWVYLQCLVGSGELAAGSGERPELRLVLLPAAQVKVIGNWDVVGLRGTGSHDARVNRASCLPHRTCAFTDAPTISIAAGRLPARDQGGLVIAAVACGIARGAIDAAAELAVAKYPAFSSVVLADQAVFQDRLGEAEMTLRAGRALLYAEIAEAEGSVGGEELRSRLRVRAAGAQVVELAGRALDVAYRLAGGTAVYRSAPFERRLRDMAAATQHFAVGRSSYTLLGAHLAGNDPDPASI